MAYMKDISVFQRKTPISMVLAGLLMAVFGVLLSVGLTSCGPKQVDVPDLEYLTSADAEKALTDAGLKLGSVTEKEDAEIKLGDLVLEQSVAADTKADEGSSVDIVVTKGPKSGDIVKVPDLTGMTVEEAEKALSDALLIPVPGDSINSDTIEPGKVCDQSTKGGTELTVLDTVTYYVSLGKEKVAVPDVVGKTLSEARDALSQVGLGCDTTTSYSDTVAQDSVISQNVQKDEQVDKGSTIVLEVSLGKKPDDRVTVPNLISYNLTAAKATLDSAGLKYTYTGEESGTVTAMNPAPGAKVDQGSTVTFELTDAEKNAIEALDVEKIVWENGLGEYVESKSEQVEGKWYLKAECKDANGKKHTFYIDKDKKVYVLKDNGKLKQF